MTTMAMNTHILSARTAWLLSQVTATAEPEELKRLECANLRAICDVADAGSEMAKDYLENAGLIADSILIKSDG